MEEYYFLIRYKEQKQSPELGIGNYDPEAGLRTGFAYGQEGIIEFIKQGYDVYKFPLPGMVKMRLSELNEDLLLEEIVT